MKKNNSNSSNNLKVIEKKGKQKNQVISPASSKRRQSSIRGANSTVRGTNSNVRGVHPKVRGGNPKVRGVKPKKPSNTWIYMKKGLMFLIKLFSLITISVFTAWLFVQILEELQFQQQARIELKEKQTIQLHQLELVFKSDGPSVNFYVDHLNENGDSTLELVELPSERLTYHERGDFPYPYLKVVCENSREACSLEEAKRLDFYFSPEDFKLIDIR